jgi:hypothetical protein
MSTYSIVKAKLFGKSRMQLEFDNPADGMEASHRFIFPLENRMKRPEPLVVAVALSLYAYNVSAGERACKLSEHFDAIGEGCMGIDEMAHILINNGGYAATELPQETAEVYVRHAMEKYGKEAERRVAINRDAYIA